MAGRNIGAFWKPKGDSKASLTGTIDFMGVSIRVAMFKNEKKEKENHPDYNIVSYGIDMPKNVPSSPSNETMVNLDDMDGMPF
jgi:uncharacterized protein (DUF736 family)